MKSSEAQISKPRVKTASPFVLVVQMGARRGYEMARMLEGRGALVRLHTSTAWSHGSEPSILVQRIMGINEGIVERRTVRDLPPDKLSSTVVPELVGSILSRLQFNGERRYRIEDSFLGLSVMLAGIRGSSVVLNSTGNGGNRFLKWAKRQGCRVATDVVITPSVYEILQTENMRWPGWEPPRDFAAEIERNKRHIERVVAVSDLLMSPSQTVDDGLSHVKGFDASRLVRLPYALGTARIKRGRPRYRRVLFAGEAGLRKGLPYLAEAARLLTPLGYEFYVAGHVSSNVRDRAECVELGFLGHLGPKQMAIEFEEADVFCLPSLAEGMASVTLEALAYGVPCVVTRSAGAPVRNGENGIIVPERNGVAIAEAIRAIAEDRPTRDRMSLAALETASVHSLDAIGDRLFAVLEDLASV